MRTSFGTVLVWVSALTMCSLTCTVVLPLMLLSIQKHHSFKRYDMWLMFLMLAALLSILPPAIMYLLLSLATKVFSALRVDNDCEKIIARSTRWWILSGGLGVVGWVTYTIQWLITGRASFFLHLALCFVILLPVIAFLQVKSCYSQIKVRTTQ
jgi:hypothetical protein